MTDKEKQALVLKLSKVTGYTVRKCTTLLKDNDWAFDKANPIKVNDLFADDTKPSTEQKPSNTIKNEVPAKKTTKARNSKKNKMPEVVETDVVEEPKHKVKENDYSDFEWYIQRCQEQAKDKGASAKPVQIATGYYTMYEIVNYAKSLGLKIQNEKK